MRGLCTAKDHWVNSNTPIYPTRAWAPFVFASYARDTLSSTIDSSLVWLFKFMLINITNMEGGGGGPWGTPEVALWALIGCSMGKAWDLAPCQVHSRYKVIFDSFIHSTNIHWAPTIYTLLGIRDAAMNKAKHFCPHSAYFIVKEIEQ